MTYLQLVNAVLSRLREDSVSTLAGSDDVVVNMVKDFVNDAKRTVEDAHSWSVLSKEWTENTSSSVDTVVLTNSTRSAIIDGVYDDSGIAIKPMNKTTLRQKALQAGSAKDSPRYYIVDGAESNGNIRLRLFPAPASVEPIHVFGYHRSAALVNDTDVLAVPSQPVIYFAQALAARERGEVGGLASAEIMALATRYLSDAIAIDATNTDMDNIWTTV